MKKRNKITLFSLILLCWTAVSFSDEVPCPDPCPSPCADSSNYLPWLMEFRETLEDIKIKCSSDPEDINFYIDPTNDTRIDTATDDGDMEGFEKHSKQPKKRFWNIGPSIGIGHDVRLIGVDFKHSDLPRFVFGVKYYEAENDNLFISSKNLFPKRRREFHVKDNDGFLATVTFWVKPPK